MKSLLTLAALVIASGIAAGAAHEAGDANRTGNETEEPVVAGALFSPLIVLALVVGLALLIGVIVAVVARR